MLTTHLYTSVQLYAQRSNPLVQAIILACMRIGCPDSKASLYAVDPITWLELLQAEEPSRFFVVSVQISTTGMMSGIEVLAILFGRQLVTKSLDSFPRAGIDMLLYPGLRPALVLQTIDRMKTEFLRTTLELQQYKCRLRRPGVVALVRSDELHKVMLYRQVGTEFVLVHSKR